jgi:lipoyl(octanoyl) transferase
MSTDWSEEVMKEHPRSNIQHPMPKGSSAPLSFDVERSMLDVECFPISNNWILLDSGSCAAAFNMALDEALLENVSQLRKPVLRFYGWTELAATFGYFQKFSEVESVTPLRPLIRRPTGGGIVPHDADWTYSAVFPPGHEWHSLKAVESYRRIHDWLRLAFAELKVKTELAPDGKKSLPGRCFAGHEQFDLLWRGKKIAGAAQRRNKSGLLIQGSVQPPAISVSRGDWEQAMMTVAATRFDVCWQTDASDAKLLAAANQLAAGKFSQSAYNQKR